MTGASTEVLLHPVRIKILTILADREATPQEMSALVQDVPKASLYRHLNILRAVGAIREVREYRVRGTYEKVYALETATGPLAGLALADGSPGARVADWLNRMVRTEPPAPAPFLNGNGHWQRSAALTPEQAREFKEMVDAWLATHEPSAVAGAGRYVVRLESEKS
jgi:DNA-binding transcriptional ArsR family regulator